MKSLYWAGLLAGAMLWPVGCLLPEEGGPAAREGKAAQAKPVQDGKWMEGDAESGGLRTSNGLSIAAKAASGPTKGYIAVWRKTNAATRVLGSFGEGDMKDQIAAKKELGYRIYKLDIAKKPGGEFVYSAVFRKIDDPTSYLLGGTREEFEAKHQDMKGKDFSLISFDIADSRYAAVWLKDGRSQWWMTRSDTWQEFKDRVHGHEDEGYRLYQYGKDGSNGYFGYMRANSDDFRYVNENDPKDFAAKIVSNRDAGYALVDANINGKTYMGTMVKDPDPSAYCFRCTWDELKDADGRYGAGGMEIVSLRRHDFDETGFRNRSSDRLKMHVKKSLCKGWLGEEISLDFGATRFGSSDEDGPVAFNQCVSRAEGNLSLFNHDGFSFVGSGSQPTKKGQCTFGWELRGEPEDDEDEPVTPPRTTYCSEVTAYQCNDIRGFALDLDQYPESRACSQVSARDAETQAVRSTGVNRCGVGVLTSNCCFMSAINTTD